MTEYDKLVNEDADNSIRPRLKDINKFGIGHNINAFDGLLKKIKQELNLYLKQLRLILKEGLL